MKDNYLTIHTSILPDIFEKVLYAKKLVEEQHKSVSTVCKELDISRSTFYKYKDKISSPNDNKSINIKIVKADSPYAIIDSLNQIVINGGKIIKVDTFKLEDTIEINIYMDIKDLYIKINKLLELIKNDKTVEKVIII